MKTFIFSTLLSIIVLAVTHADTCGDKFTNVDFQGNDIAQQPVEGSLDDQITACCSVCKKNTLCAGYTLFNNVCYIKYAWGKTTAKNGAVSVRVRGPNAKCPTYKKDSDYFGNDISHVAMDPSATEFEKIATCCDTCSTTKECQRFTLYNNVCYLKKGYGQSVSKPGAISGEYKDYHAPTCGDIFEHTDFFGHDLTNIKVSGNRDEQIAACCFSCSTNTQCAGYTLFDNTCYLKYAWVKTTDKQGALSVRVRGPNAKCPTYYQDSDLAGNDIRNFAVNATATSAEKLSNCCDGCSATPNCKGFTLYKDVCYLKSQAGASNSLPGAISGLYEPAK